MTLQAALASVLLVGLPLLLLALGVLVHAYYVARPRNAARADRLIEELVADSVDQLIAQLRAPEPAPLPPHVAFRAALQAAPDLTRPVTPHASHRFGALDDRSVPPATSAPMPHLGMAVAQLLTEGLSDRSIARRLGIGIEEVRAARLNTGRSSSQRSAA